MAEYAEIRKANRYIQSVNVKVGLAAIVKVNADHILPRSMAKLIGKDTPSARQKAVAVNVPYSLNKARSDARVNLGPISGEVHNRDLVEMARCLEF